jgi:ribosomal protein S18 acetylase RimI-like enzyme
VIEIRALSRADFDRVSGALPLERFDGWGEGWTYLVAWEDGRPVGHAHVAWTGTELGLPELQDVYVLPERRGRGVGTALTLAAEALAAEQGHGRCSLSVSEQNEAARRLYERLGYERAAHPPQRIRGTIVIRSGPLEVDDTLLYFTKRIG